MGQEKSAYRSKLQLHEEEVTRRRQCGSPGQTESTEKSQNFRKLLEMLPSPLYLPYFLNEKSEGR